MDKWYREEVKHEKILESLEYLHTFKAYSIHGHSSILLEYLSSRVVLKMTTTWGMISYLFFIEMLTKYWNRLPRQAMESPTLQVLKGNAWMWDLRCVSVVNMDILG